MTLNEINDALFQISFHSGNGNPRIVVQAQDNIKAIFRQQEERIAELTKERDGFRTSWEDAVNNQTDIEWQRIQAMVAMSKIQDIVTTYRNTVKQDDNNSRT